jgi:hypothetical protein
MLQICNRQSHFFQQKCIHDYNASTDFLQPIALINPTNKSQLMAVQLHRYSRANVVCTSWPHFHLVYVILCDRCGLLIYMAYALEANIVHFVFILMRLFQFGETLINGALEIEIRDSW